MFFSNPRRHPSLPQDDSAREQEKRAKQIASTATDYQWDFEVPSVEGVPMAKKVPFDDQPTIAWFIKVIDVALAVVRNTLVDLVDDDSDDVKALKSIEQEFSGIKATQQERDEVADDDWMFDALSKTKRLLSMDVVNARANLDKLVDVIKNQPVPESLLAKDGLAAYKGLFETIELEPLAENFQKDEIFAYYRVGGPNPMLIQCIDAIPEKFQVSNEGYQGVMGSDDSLELALTERRLFLMDYHELQLMVDNPGFTDGQPKQLFAPFALFARAQGAEDLTPVAIQRAQEMDEAGVVYQQSDEAAEGYWQWQTAKSIMQMADGNYHELFVHLARTHLMMEAFKVATNRNLAEKHPVNILLIPHFEGTLYINNSAANSLIAEGGPIDQIFAAEISKTQEAAGTDRLNYDFYANMLPTDLENRNVADPDILPNFPYRDDALLVWDAIKQWTTEYTNIYYQDDEAIVGDTELAAWTADLMGDGKIAGFKPITSKEQLADVLTMVIFTASAQHAAVNFPQRSIMTYAPAVSGAVWGPQPPAGTNADEWIATMPPLPEAKEQLNLLYVLGSVYYRQLGEYRTNDFPYLSWFQDKEITGKGMALDRFNDALDEVTKTIEARNAKRAIPYIHLLPKNIPASINI